MRFYSEHHAFTCAVDLHGRTLYLCVLDRVDHVIFHRNLSCRWEAVLGAIAPFHEDLPTDRRCPSPEPVTNASIEIAVSRSPDMAPAASR